MAVKACSYKRKFWTAVKRGERTARRTERPQTQAPQTAQRIASYRASLSAGVEAAEADGAGSRIHRSSWNLQWERTRRSAEVQICTRYPCRCTGMNAIP